MAIICMRCSHAIEIKLALCGRWALCQTSPSDSKALRIMYQMTEQGCTAPRVRSQCNRTGALYDILRNHSASLQGPLCSWPSASKLWHARRAPQPRGADSASEEIPEHIISCGRHSTQHQDAGAGAGRELPPLDQSPQAQECACSCRHMHLSGPHNASVSEWNSSILQRWRIPTVPVLCVDIALVCCLTTFYVAAQRAMLSGQKSSVAAQQNWSGMSGAAC